MSFMDKLMFWKQGKEYSNSSEASAGFNNGYDNLGLSASDPGLGLGNEATADNAFSSHVNTETNHDNNAFAGMQSHGSLVNEEKAASSSFGSGFENPASHNSFQNSYNEQNSFNHNSYNSQYSQPTIVEETKSLAIDKELELISTKLDMLKASIESISQRLINIERSANKENGRQAW